MRHVSAGLERHTKGLSVTELTLQSTGDGQCDEEVVEDDGAPRERSANGEGMEQVAASAEGAE